MKKRVVITGIGAIGQNVITLVTIITSSRQYS